MTCTKLEDIFKPENKDKKYSYVEVANLIVDHIPFCPECFKWWEYHFISNKEAKIQDCEKEEQSCSDTTTVK